MPSEETSPRKKKYVRAVGPRLSMLLFSVFVLFALLGANSGIGISIGDDSVVDARTLAELERALRDSGYLRRGADGECALTC